MDIRTRLGLFVLVAIWLFFAACTTPGTDFPLSKPDPEGPTYELIPRWTMHGGAVVLPGGAELFVSYRSSKGLELKRVDREGVTHWQTTLPDLQPSFNAIPFENWDREPCVVLLGPDLVYLRQPLDQSVTYTSNHFIKLAVVPGAAMPELFTAEFIHDPSSRDSSGYILRRYTLDGTCLWTRPFTHTFDVQGWTQPDGRVLPVSLFDGLDVLNPDTGEVIASIAPDLGGIRFGINPDPNAKVMFVGSQRGWDHRLAGFDRDGMQLWAAENAGPGDKYNGGYPVGYAIEPSLNLFAVGYRNEGVTVHDLSTGIMLARINCGAKAEPHWLKNGDGQTMLVTNSIRGIEAFQLIRTSRSVTRLGEDPAEKGH